MVRHSLGSAGQGSKPHFPISHMIKKVNNCKIMKLENSLTPHKNKFKMDQRSKCKDGYYKTLRQKHKQNML